MPGQNFIDDYLCQVLTDLNKSMLSVLQLHLYK